MLSVNNVLPLWVILDFFLYVTSTLSYSLWSHLPKKDQLYMAGLFFLISGEFQGWYIVTWWLTYLNLVSGLYSNSHQCLSISALPNGLRKMQQQIRKKVVQKSKTWPFISKKWSGISENNYINNYFKCRIKYCYSEKRAEVNWMCWKVS